MKKLVIVDIKHYNNGYSYTETAESEIIDFNESTVKEYFDYYSTNYIIDNDTQFAEIIIKIYDKNADPLFDEPESTVGYVFV